MLLLEKLVNKFLLNEGVRKTKKGEFLFHGSGKELKSLKPMPSPILDDEKAVFATNERWLALAFIPKWSDKDIELGFTNDEPELKELTKNAFKVFETSGYIHKVSSKGFHGDKRLGLQGNEFIKEEEVEVLEVEVVENILELIKQESVKLVIHSNYLK